MDLSYPTGNIVASTGGSLNLVRSTTLEDAMTGPQKTKDFPM